MPFRIRTGTFIYQFTRHFCYVYISTCVSRFYTLWLVTPSSCFKSTTSWSIEFQLITTQNFFTFWRTLKLLPHKNNTKSHAILIWCALWNITIVLYLLLSSIIITDKPINNACFLSLREFWEEQNFLLLCFHKSVNL